MTYMLLLTIRPASITCSNSKAVLKLTFHIDICAFSTMPTGVACLSNVISMSVSGNIRDNPSFSIFLLHCCLCVSKCQLKRTQPHHTQESYFCLLWQNDYSCLKWMLELSNVKQWQISLIFETTTPHANFWIDGYTLYANTLK